MASGSSKKVSRLAICRASVTAAAKPFIARASHHAHERLSKRPMAPSIEIAEITAIIPAAHIKRRLIVSAFGKLLAEALPNACRNTLEEAAAPAYLHTPKSRNPKTMYHRGSDESKGNPSTNLLIY